MKVKMNNQRRMFRGRGGPTDRRLPKHNARRRKQHPEIETVVKPPKYTEPAPRMHQTEQESEKLKDESNNEWNEVLTDETLGMNLTANQLEAEFLHSDNNDNENDNNLQRHSCLEEIQHLKHRVRNVQESIQTSNSLANESVFQEIVLNATRNCVNEWRSIARHYSSSKAAEMGESDISIETRKETGLAVFQLVQLSLQSGPLSGAKAGYFKRCGGDVAIMALSFLEDVIPQHETLGEWMGFSTKQLDAMNKWKANAEKAAMSNKAPSKSVLKQQYLAQRNGRKT